jgi:hypothetical protein
MKKSIINIKENKTTSLMEYISATSNNQGITIYNYYNGKTENATKSTFNKYAFIEYLKSIQISKRIIKQVENL